MKRYDVENRRYELVDGILGLLAHDMARDAQLSIHLDLLAVEDARKLRSSSVVDNWKVKVYEDPWLTLRGRLLDGTKFILVMREHLRIRQGWKKGRSGKSKLKVKRKTRTSATLRLKTDLEGYLSVLSAHPLRRADSVTGR